MWGPLALNKGFRALTEVYLPTLHPQSHPICEYNIRVTLCFLFTPANQEVARDVKTDLSKIRTIQNRSIQGPPVQESDKQSSRQA